MGNFEIFDWKLTFYDLLHGLGLLLATYWIGWIVYTRVFHPLARFPGPFWASVSRAWIVRSVIRGNTHKTQRMLHTRYGHVVRIAPNELSISDPEAIKIIYGVNSGFIESDFYLAFRAPYTRYPDHFTSTDEKVHAQRRRIVNGVYTMQSILQSEPYVNKCTEVLLQQLEDVADAKASIDLLEWTRMYAYDVIGELYFSKMFGLMKARGDHLGIMKSTDTLIPAMAISSVMPSYLRSFFMLVGVLFAETRKGLSALNDLATAADSAVQSHVQASSSDDSVIRRTDIISKVFNIHRDQGGKLDFQIDDVKLEAFGGYFAGSDTTAIHLSTTLYYILKNPGVYAALNNEIVQATQRGELSFPHISYHEASKLRYLSACVKEGARLHPSVALTMPRNVPSNGRSISGQWIPGGVRVGINPTVVQLDKTVFGDDAEKYNPDRWLKPDADKMNKYILQFGAGSRMCMGKNISLCELYKVIPELLRSYRLELSSPEKDLETSGFWFYKPAPMHIRVYRK
ncbi:Cytochrome P450 E-class group I [Penicillium canescens]|uniref:Cytochrome P450 E-class group I n=1 Tax=Penicillium canescens TaxID=5083 RepID=A0AAD6I000_PENCN|nr:Cytochrome P450 E-class group I [Penicillium canescens]KAJ6023644.1 Cytochrome P450 E-class group I [Penicillium canescens]KAJ6025079.1 Cytochrome P450 E-class group I [Penicillium canescens]KAJ6042943.1 Cytochrome P450 E-class group I [Penicillium canescens]